ncbi:hypothetical protein [Aristaeella lactis]|uniref:Uncharacterized protein n=1 Tax=Aristaeella lactis TaxID=3046383 RepID=A0AC61PHS1_9FIRM|nr:hypothetical protein [Aristaeella lactis]QUA53566.1 hypothetical protein JYE50_02715 [Aristaeella lactis]SMC36813.1 hypothetical protein SAMN06297397_0340 [Aristaeella lactis]
MKMPIINFDEHFAEFMSDWMKAHEDQYANFDEMEEDMPRIYMAFLNTRAKWLGNVTPGAYFTQFEDPKVLVDWLAQYCEEGTPVPDLLMEQITTVGRPCEKRLLELLKDEEATEEAKMIAVNLLREMDSVLPKMLYIRWQLDRNPQDELKDNALESLTEMGETVVQPILQELPGANEAGEEALLEVLSHFPGKEQIFKLALKLFRERKERRALFAGYLAKLGDDRALPELTAAAEEEKLPYLTFIEIRNAIETLGGVCPERTYEDDPEYEALRDLDLT